MIRDKLKQGLGNWVDGDKFFDREGELKVFREKLLERVSLLLIAPRRIGKTSFMREAGRQLAGEINALHVDLQKANSPEEAIVELGMSCRPFKGIWEKAVGAFGDFFGKVENLKISDVTVTLRGTLTSSNWSQKGDELIAVLARVADETSKPVVVFLDEVPILVNRILKESPGDFATRKLAADNFMSWIRGNLIRHGGRVVFVVTGSIGLEPVLRSAGLSGTLNAFHPFELAPWKSEVATDCLLALALEKEFPLPKAVAEHMVQKLGCAIPHHIQTFFDHVRTSYILDEQKGDVTVEQVNDVYTKKMTGLQGHADLMHMEERLRLVLEDKRFQLALALLTQAAITERLTPAATKIISAKAVATRDDLLETLGILTHDGYLKAHGEDFVFVSRLVRDWWKNRFGHGYEIV